MEVLCAFNPGATMVADQRLMLLRVAERPIQEKGWVSTAAIDAGTGELQIQRFRENDPDLDASDPRAIIHRGMIHLTSISHLRAAVSTDGQHFQLNSKPALKGSGPYETFGVEDARITRIEDAYCVTYTGASHHGVTTCLARTRDFETFEKLGVMFAPDNKDIALFPQKINGRYYTLHRPSPRHLGTMAIWLASSDNLLDWGDHHTVISTRAGFWDCERVGAGASPIRTGDGWLALYHGVDYQTRYCTGAVLLDFEEPWKVIARSEEPFFIPEAEYETRGFMPGVVFHNGLIQTGEDSLELYYGAADESSCVATASIREILGSLKRIS
jgi:predicted GH43/DUF377 family glycosyl hydrolase